MWLDPTMRQHFKVFHDHRAGACDLQEFLTDWRSGLWTRTNCTVQWYSRELRICSCAMCSMRWARKRARRQDRQGTRRQLREAAAQAAAGELDEDVPSPYRGDVW
jgi:hypothetical protein